MTKDVTVIVIGLALLAVVWIGWVQFTMWRSATNGEDLVACTADAMMCPDGTYVGRTGPNCEFVCPGE